MGKRIAEFFRIPAEIRAEFWQDTLQKNQLSLLVICLMILGMELFNMARVLFWSASGLGTLNNRIYFAMYCALCLAAVLYLLLQHLLRNAPTFVRWIIQYGMVLFAFLWHMGLNAYDLMRDPAAEVSLFLTAFLALAVFIQMPPLFSLISYSTAYAVFMLLAGAVLDSGARINLTVAAIVSLAVSLTTCRHRVVRLVQQREIRQINQQLQDMLQKDPLTGLLNTAAFQSCAAAHLQRACAAHPAALFIIDLDNFKAVNDHFGHPCGDHVLRETALRLQAVFPDAAGIGRIGGDEFAMVFSSGAADTLPQRLTQHLLPELAQIQWQGKTLGASCSAGICRVCSADIPYGRAYHQADQALYEAKRCGKGCSCQKILS